MALQIADVIITGSEVNNRHGTGIFLKRIFQDDSQIISIRSSNGYKGEQDFGKLNFCYKSNQNNLLSYFEGVQVRRILCIPYNSDDVLTALELKRVFAAPLCTYVMDDQNILATGISDTLMHDLLIKSELRLAISQEMRDMYHAKYQVPLTFVPPLVESKLFGGSIEMLNTSQAQNKVGILIGNIWSQKAFQLLYSTLETSKQQIHWYGQASLEAFSYASQSNNLDESAIKLFGFLPTEQDLVQNMRQYPYAVIPSGTIDQQDDRPEISQFSLPSRIPFIIATSHTPIIVLGNQRGAAARFVTRFNVGVVCEYEDSKFIETVHYICQPHIQRIMRQNAANITSCFSVDGFSEWLWQSLELHRPCDTTFENLSDHPDIEALMPTLFFYAKQAFDSKNYQDLLDQISNLRLERDKMHWELVNAQATVKHVEIFRDIAEREILAMKTSKFWQLREAWFKLKGRIKRG
ncbi:hypothetical protein [Synechococcus sp. PCC 6312]|uniref:hypothetical protein n=1 Tax=Synechococcus sp. (strain ATCC 27167 / PCC 6312) TaxID=195253 RepID=UPI00029F4BDB|nr:hypothetical protein [Synechococcus sp. PCC 6312]AFY62262.1 hypothetical protein Syn6312_3216 [Synechococcus sp. PCC 6312]